MRKIFPMYHRVFCLCLALAFTAGIEHGAGENWENVISSDLQNIRLLKQKLRTRSHEAMIEERELKAQAAAAAASGDENSALSLRARYKQARRQNIAEKKANKKKLVDAKRKWSSDRRSARAANGR